MKIYANIQKQIVTYYRLLQEQYSSKNVQRTLIGLLFLITIAGGYVLNRWYVNRREQKSFELLSEVMESFVQAQRSTQGLDPQNDHEKIQQTWEDVLMLLDALHKESMGSYLTPYFLVFKAQVILEKDQNLEAAIGLMDEALAQISKKSEIGNLFHMKRIKMGFDSQDATIRDQSLKDLIAISEDKNHCCQEEALYLLGQWYVFQGQIEQAQNAWKSLVLNTDETALLKSPWVKLAQEKLGLSSKSQVE